MSHHIFSYLASYHLMCYGMWDYNQYLFFNCCPDLRNLSINLITFKDL